MSTGNGTTTVGAAQQLRNFLLSEPSQPTEVESEQAEPKQPEQETEAGEVDAQAQETETEAEGQETPEGDTETDQQLFTVKVDGEEKEVTLEELKSGFMMESNYRKKTTEVARMRDEVEAKGLEVDEQLSKAKELLQLEVDGLNSEEMQQLREEDPDRYLKEFDKVENKRKKFEELQAKRVVEQKRREEKLVAKEREALITAFPEWSDASVMQREGAELVNVLKDVGFTDAEASSMTDHRMFIMAKQISQLKSIQSADLKAKKTASKSKTAKPGTTTNKAEVNDKAVKQQRQKFKSSGSVKDAAILLSMS